jgi:ribosomal-protein-alanine N-acetyltransferase
LTLEKGKSDKSVAYSKLDGPSFRGHGESTCAIVLRETTELCGAISLGINQRHQHAELGYWLGVPHWNRGYATEATTALLSYGFTTWQFHRIYARHFTRNPASGRVMQKLGMKLGLM